VSQEPQARQPEGSQFGSEGLAEKIRPAGRLTCVSIGRSAMKITLRVTGGVTGPIGAVVRELDLGALSAAERAQAEPLITAARLFDRPAKQMVASPKPQDFRYQLDVSDGPRSSQLTFQLGAVDAAMRALVDWIEDNVAPTPAVSR
jgi:hypothetical protein